MLFSKELLKGTAELIVLQTLSDYGESYGYELTKSIATQSDNVFEFQEGTLYPLLYRLELKKYIESQKKNAPNGKERRYYSITDLGKKQLKEKKKELNLFVGGLTKAFRMTV